MDNLLKYNLTSFCESTGFSLISVSGDDSSSFLQSQFTNDVLELDNDSIDHLLSGYCNPKGRLIALIRVLKIKQHDYLLILPSELVDTVAKRLKLFVLRSKVKIELASDHLSLIGVWGKDINIEVGKMKKLDNLVFIKDVDCPELGKRGWLIGDKNSIENSINYLKKIPYINDFNRYYWKSSELFAGNLWIDNSNTESFIPQSINLDLNNGVSFTKGCYPGQEIVARTHYLGKVKRRLLLAKVNESELIGTEVEINLPVYQSTLDEDSPLEVGFVVDYSYFSLNNNQKQVILLIQCQMNKLRTQNSQRVLSFQNTNGPKLTLLNFPYAMDVTAEKEK